MRKYTFRIMKSGLLFIVTLLMGTIIMAKAEAQTSWNQGWSFSPFTFFSTPYYFEQTNYQGWDGGQYQTWSYPIATYFWGQTAANNWSFPSYPVFNYTPQFEPNWWPQSSFLNYNRQGYDELSSSINSGRTASWCEPFGYQRDISLYEDLDFSRPAIGHGIIDPEIYNQEPEIVPSQVPISDR